MLPKLQLFLLRLRIRRHLFIISLYRRNPAALQSKRLEAHCTKATLLMNLEEKLLKK